MAGVLFAAFGLLMGCATLRGDPPTNSNEVLAQVAISSAINVAVNQVVTREHATPADIKLRAGHILTVANDLKALGSDKLSTLPQIREALAPLLDKLNLDPYDRSQANLLVSALAAVGLEHTDTANYVARVGFLLNEVIAAASAYGSG